MSSGRRESYRVIYTRSYLRDLERFNAAINNRVVRATENLASNPFLGKPLRGELKGYYSLRVGSYRVIYTVEEKSRTVVLRAAGHRGRIYDS